jgi:hypothetical protein
MIWLHVASIDAPLAVGLHAVFARVELGIWQVLSHGSLKRSAFSSLHE